MSRRLCILLKSLHSGGVEKMMLNLACGFLELGYEVDMVLFEKTGARVKAVPEHVRLVSLAEIVSGGSWPGIRLVSLMRAFRAYVAGAKPDVVISAKEQANLVNVMVKRVAGYKSVITRHVPLDRSLVGTDAKPYVRWLYRTVLWRADGIISVSQGIAEELRALIPERAHRKVAVVDNPVLDDSIFEMSLQPVQDPWLIDKSLPLIVASGRLSRQKGFDVLLEAFSILRKRLPSRLAILGDGELQDRLMEQIKSLSLEQEARIVGYVDNPYPYYRNADVFVLSSRWEGQPLVLIEVLALGTKIVATDCRTGPSEILRGGERGLLVPLEDAEALADGMYSALSSEPGQRGSTVVSEYTVQTACEKYDELFCSLMSG